MFNVDVAPDCEIALKPRVASVPAPPLAVPQRRRARRRFAPNAPRATLALLSIAMVALTMFGLVVLPALNI